EARILPLNHTRLRFAATRQAHAEPDSFYQTARLLATGLRSAPDETAKLHSKRKYNHLPATKHVQIRRRSLCQ
ncbi:MAG: hypothetical protein WAO21_03670, partial [Verrucomicrobiia bacterium]